MIKLSFFAERVVDAHARISRRRHGDGCFFIANVTLTNCCPRGTTPKDCTAAIYLDFKIKLVITLAAGGGVLGDVFLYPRRGIS